jgi:hypothetical protein
VDRFWLYLEYKHLLIYYEDDDVDSLMVFEDEEPMVPVTTEAFVTQNQADLEIAVNQAMKPLTVRRRKFVRLVLAGYSKGRAYVMSGYKAKNLGVATSGGYEFVKRPDVASALEAGRNLQLARDGIPPEAKKQHLWKLAKVTADEDNPNFNARASIAAVHEVNLMDGGHAAKRMDVSGNIGFSLNYELVLPGGREPIDVEATEIPDEVGPGKLSQPPKPR